MRLKDKVAIITGAGSGFGEAMALRFASEGASITANDMNAGGGERVCAAIREQGGQAIFIQGDVSKRSDVKALVEKTLAEFGRVDILVNNAGYTHRKQSMLTVPEESFDRVFAVNVKALYFAALEVVPVMRRQGGGCILNTASGQGLSPTPGLAWYAASKGAVVTATKAMALELACDRIRVNCLCPTASDTGMFDDFAGGATPQRRAEMAAAVPLGRIATPQDVANAALYLASDEADFITGVAFPIDGGRTV